jgi:predicted protein tyrosine phosphatase
MDIKICSHNDAILFLGRNHGKWASVVVMNSFGINRAVVETIIKYSKESLVLSFDDIDCSMVGFVKPSLSDVERALEFTKDQSKVVFTCPIGATRSPSLAYVCGCQTVDPNEAIRVLTPGKHFLNREIIAIAKKILNNSRITNAYEKYKLE